MNINLLNKLLVIPILFITPFLINFIGNSISKDSIIYLNIGQGDSTLICVKVNKCGLIDTGKQSNIIEKIKGYTSSPLEFILLTHPDFDHEGQVINILKQIGSKNVFFSFTKKGEALTKQILDLNSTRVFELRDYNDFSFGNYSFDILWPSALIDLDQLESNDTSTTILLNNYQHKFFLAGDLGSRLELLTQEEFQFNNIDISKLSHHGSKNSSSIEFLGKIMPKLAIISVGKNSYGHPSKEVMGNLQQLGLRYLRTDTDGDIKISISEAELEIHTQNSKKSYIILN